MLRQKLFNRRGIIRYWPTFGRPLPPSPGVEGEHEAASLPSLRESPRERERRALPARSIPEECASLDLQGTGISRLQCCPGVRERVRSSSERVSDPNPPKEVLHSDWPLNNVVFHHGKERLKPSDIGSIPPDLPGSSGALEPGLLPPSDH
jgi:hypothetical protein